MSGPGLLVGAARGDALGLVAATLGSVGLAAVSAPALLVIALVAAAVACAFAMRGRPAARLRLRLALVGVAAFCALLWAVGSWQWGPDGFSPDAQGIDAALTVTLRTHAIVLWCAACLARLDEARLVAALRMLRCPSALCALLELSLRYRGVLVDVWRHQSQAMRARGFRPAPTRASLALLGEAIGLLVIDALERADRIERAMRARGWDPDPRHAPHARRP